MTSVKVVKLAEVRLNLRDEPLRLICPNCETMFDTMEVPTECPNNNCFAQVTCAARPNGGEKR